MQVRTLNRVAMTHPMAVTNCNIDMESLISDPNRSIATLAITTLLKTGAFAGRACRCGCILRGLQAPSQGRNAAACRVARARIVSGILRCSVPESVSAARPASAS